MLNSIKVYIGTSIISKNKGSFSLTLFGNDDSLSMPTSQIKIKNQITTQKLTLEAILSLFNSFKTTKVDNPIKVIIFVNDTVLASELNTKIIDQRDQKYSKDFIYLFDLETKLSNKISATYKESSVLGYIKKVKR